MRTYGPAISTGRRRCSSGRGDPVAGDLVLIVETDDQPFEIDRHVGALQAQAVGKRARLEPAAQAIDGRLALVELQNGDAAPTYLAGTRNFYAITRYTWSSYYAMAVIDLADALKARRVAVSIRSGGGTASR